MANLSISAVCNQQCAYCFTLDQRRMSRNGQGGEASESFLSATAFEARLDFLTRSHIDEVRLMGGEPTLHPQFITLVEQAIQRIDKVMVFSNGLMPEPALAYLASLPSDRCTVLVNINAPEETRPTYHAQRLATIRRLGERAMLGFNIHRLDFTMDFLLPIIAETGCQSLIRVGIAQPCLSGENRHVHPNQYVAIGRKLTDFAEVAARQGCVLDFDCGFVRCMFSDVDLQRLEGLGTHIGWRCNPILDIDIEGNVIYCYPLARLGHLPLASGRDAASLRQAFEARTRAYRVVGVFPECSTCAFKASGECTGGCLSATIRRFRHTPFTVHKPGGE